jgi:hypothetical protein
MTEKAPAAPPEVLDNMLAPELFSDGAFSFFVLAGVVRIVFTSVRAPQCRAGPGQPVPVVVARVSMPVLAAQELALSLNNFLETNGLSPSAVVTAGKTKQ